MERTSWYLLVTAALLALLVFSVLISITFGNADISVREVYQVVLYEVFHIQSLEEYGTGAIHDVVWLIRFPRAVLAVAVGMGLAVCGAVMQAVVKNSLADPYVLGISSGATLGATLAIMLGIGTVFGSNSVGDHGVFRRAGGFLSGIVYFQYRREAGSGKTDPCRHGGQCGLFRVFQLCAVYRQRQGRVPVGHLLGDGQSCRRQVRKCEGDLSCDPDRLSSVLDSVQESELMLYGDETAITLGTNLQNVRMCYMILVSVIVGFAVYAARNDWVCGIDHPPCGAPVVRYGSPEADPSLCALRSDLPDLVRRAVPGHSGKF